MNREDLLASICKRAQDYQPGSITPDHVERWVRQFPTEIQLLLLDELAHILSKFYFSKNDIKDALKRFFTGNRNDKDIDRSKVTSINLLDIQKSGSSQKDLLALAKSVIAEENLPLANKGDANIHVYIDDCVYTGNKFRYDLVPWIENTSFPPGSKLITYHLAVHTQGFQYALDHIRQAAAKKQLEVKPYKKLIINNNKNCHNENLEVMWPAQCIGNKYVDEYCDRVEEICQSNGWNGNRLFREHPINSEVLFQRQENRDIIEQAFLKIGAKLIISANNPANSIRPMGFEKKESLGFGSTFVTFRNISNNCPLALWYGDPDNISSGPLSMWYPLFKRKV